MPTCTGRPSRPLIVITSESRWINGYYAFIRILLCLESTSQMLQINIFCLFIFNSLNMTTKCKIKSAINIKKIKLKSLKWEKTKESRQTSMNKFRRLQYCRIKHAWCQLNVTRLHLQSKALSLCNDIKFFSNDCPFS